MDKRARLNRRERKKQFGHQRTQCLDSIASCRDDYNRDRQAIEIC